MKTSKKIKLFLVDDDPLYLKTMAIEFIQHGDFDLETFATGEDCIAHLNSKPDIIVLDYHLDGIDSTAMNGLDTLDKILAINPEVSVVMLSSQDKIEVAVNCMHHRAYDYVVKSETAFLRIQKNINMILKTNKTEKELKWYMDRM